MPLPCFQHFDRTRKPYQDWLLGPRVLLASELPESSEETKDQLSCRMAAQPNALPAQDKVIVATSHIGFPNPFRMVGEIFLSGVISFWVCPAVLQGQTLKTFTFFLWFNLKSLRLALQHSRIRLPVANQGICSLTDFGSTGRIKHLDIASGHCFVFTKSLQLIDEHCGNRVHGMQPNCIKI